MSSAPTSSGPTSSISIGTARAGARRSAGARRARPYEGPEPWARRDALVVALVLLLAVVGLVIGWLGVSDTVDLNSQTRWLGFGIGALIVGGFAMVAWLLVGLRRIATLRRDVMTEVDRRHLEPTTRAIAVTDHQTTTDVLYGTVTGMRRYHAAECQLLEDKDPTFAAAAAHEQAGLIACPICLGAAHE